MLMAPCAEIPMLYIEKTSTGHRRCTCQKSKVYAPVSLPCEQHAHLTLISREHPVPICRRWWPEGSHAADLLQQPRVYRSWIIQLTRFAAAVLNATARPTRHQTLRSGRVPRRMWLPCRSAAATVTPTDQPKWPHKA